MRCEFGEHNPDCQGSFMAEECDRCGKWYCGKCDHYTACDDLSDDERTYRLCGEGEDPAEDPAACQCARWSFDEHCKEPQEVTVEYDAPNLGPGPAERRRIRVSRECAERMMENDEHCQVVEGDGEASGGAD